MTAWRITPNLENTSKTLSAPIELLLDFSRTVPPIDQTTEFLTNPTNWMIVAIAFAVSGWGMVLYLRFWRIRRTLRESMAMIARMFPDCVLIVNATGKVIASSQPAEEFFGYTSQEIVQLEVEALMPGEFTERHKQQRNAFMHGEPGQILSNEIQCVRKSGELLPANIRVKTFRLEGASYGLVAVQDLRTFKNREQDLKTLSERDPLTGVANRRLFDRDYHREWRRGLRNGTPIAVIMVDVDAFKEYNDYHGHPGGDACLKTIAGNLSAAMNRSTDTLARYGGEEFICLLPGIDEAGALSKARELCESIESASIPHGRSSVSRWVTASAGVAVAIPKQGDDMQQLIKAADAALYRAKSSGRNNAQLHSENVAPVNVPA